MAFILVLVTNMEVVKTAISFLTLKTQDSYLNNGHFYCNSSK